MGVVGEGIRMGSLSDSMENLSVFAFLAPDDVHTYISAFLFVSLSLHTRALEICYLGFFSSVASIN